MLSKVVVLEKNYFDIWVDGKKSYSPYSDPKMAKLDPQGNPMMNGDDYDYDLAKVGAYLAKNKHGCTGCHSTDGTDNGYPTWKGLYGSTKSFTDGTSGPADAEYIIESIYYPQNKIVSGYESKQMTSGWINKIDDTDMEAIIAYIEALK
jgi:cytochrome c oxidase subunit 2